jgi:hypothetical protein
MAAQMVALNRNKSFIANSRAGSLQPNSAEVDRDEELQAVLRCETLDPAEKDERADLVNITPETLMGIMPKSEKVLKKGVLDKLTTAYEWKPMQVSLTSAGIFLARVGEDLLRDLIPLFEIVDVRKRNIIPGETKEKPNSEVTVIGLQRGNSSRKMKISALMEDEDDVVLHIIEIRTVEDGYNSGRSYYFNAQSEEECNSWLQRVRTESDRAILQKQAGPSMLRRLRFYLRRVYNHVVTQSIIAMSILFSFLVNITQTEVMGLESHDTASVFSTLEYFFTLAFTVELAFNMAANLFMPFLVVSLSLPPSLSLSH